MDTLGERFPFFDLPLPRTFSHFAAPTSSPQAAFTAVDLSPFYLEQARENDEHWRSQRAPSASPAKFVRERWPGHPNGAAGSDSLEGHGDAAEGKPICQMRRSLIRVLDR